MHRVTYWTIDGDSNYMEVEDDILNLGLKVNVQYECGSGIYSFQSMYPSCILVCGSMVFQFLGHVIW